MRMIAIAPAVLSCLAVLPALQAAAQPAGAYAADLVYDVRLGSLRAFNASGQVRVDGNHYAVEAFFKKEGVVAALSQTFSGRNKVTGALSGSGIVPATGFSLIETRSSRTWQVTYGAGGTFTELHKPPMDTKPERRVSPQQKAGAVDPLTAAVFGMFRSEEPCPRTYQVFDSRRRFNVEMRKVGTARPGPADGPLLEGDGVVCEGLVHKIAGYNPQDLNDPNANRNPPKLYLARVKGATGWYPYRMEMRTSFGEVTGKLSKLTVRPLTDSERASMRQ